MTSIKTPLVCVALLAGLAAAPGIAAAADDGPVTAVRTFLDDFDKGDMAGVAAINSANHGIIDEMAPHIWLGANAYPGWLSDLTKDAASTGKTDENVSLDAIVRDQVDGDTAYVTAKVTYTYKQHGTPMVEHALMVSALANQAGAWKITGWAWAGETPQPAH